MLKVDIETKSRRNRLKPNITIQNIHLEFKEGTSTLIIGTSGAGKTTIIECILGSTRFKGQVQTDTTKSKIAYIAQHPALNKRETVFQGIYYAGRYDRPQVLPKYIEQETERLIKMLGLSYVKNNYIDKISGGQLKRVAIAAELIRNADILIMDEPDSGLDPGVAYRLSEHIRDLTHKEQKTTIVISHNVSNIAHYDKILVLAKDKNKTGGVAFFGTPLDALSWFGVSNYQEIFLRINSKEEEGEGLGNFYILKYKKEKGETK